MPQESTPQTDIKRRSTFFKIDNSRKSIIDHRKSILRPPVTATTRKSYYKNTSLKSGTSKREQLRARRLSVRNLAVHACVFLETRPMSVEYGTFLAALENGVIQVYSHHRLGEFMVQFNAVHTAGDCVLTMITDSTDTFLFTGTALGYIKIWVISEFW